MNLPRPVRERVDILKEIAASFGSVVESVTTGKKHFRANVLCPNGKRVQLTIPNNLSDHRGGLNWISQTRRTIQRMVSN